MKIPVLHQELKDVQAKTEKLEDTNKQLSQGKAQVEDELHMLQEQYKILLGKIVEEQERTAIAEQQKVRFFSFLLVVVLKRCYLCVLSCL